MEKIRFWMKENTDKWITLFWAVTFGVSLIPLLFLSRYALPACDDYYYGVKTYRAWMDTHSVMMVLRAALDTVVEYWHRWQGTYSSIFLMSLTPGIWGERWYFFTTFLMTGMLCGGIFALVHVVLKEYICQGPDTNGGNAHLQKQRIRLCTLVLCFLSLQTMVYPTDGLYWYNGAVHYVFMESVLYFQAAALLFLARGKRKDAMESGAHGRTRMLRRTVMYVLSLLFAGILGGANLITGLQSCILTAFLVLFVFGKRFYDKRKRAAGEIAEDRGKGMYFLLVMLVNFTGFAFNVFAPGNLIRETTAEGMDAIRAILFSFYWAAVYFTEWMTPLVLAGFLMLFPVLWKLAERSEKKYLHPAFAAVLSFCVFAAMFSPTLYATSSGGPDRCKNIMRITMYLLLFFNLANASGWFKSRRERSLLCRLLEDIEKSYQSWLFVSSVIVCLIFLLPADKNTYTSVSAFRSLVNGEAVQFYEENMHRIMLYTDETLPDVKVMPLTAKPYLLYKEDIGNEGGPDYWINIAVTQYYRKNSVTVEEETE